MRNVARTIAVAATLAVALTTSLTAPATAAEEASGWRTTAKSWVRTALVDRDDLEQFGLDLDANWQRADAARPVVVFVHGFNSTPEANAPLLDAVRAEGLPCGAFRYPNDGGVCGSARLLAVELAALKSRHGDRRVALVTHSMGGLVARAAIEDPGLDPGNVCRLVMLAPPNGGTRLAHFAVGTDLCEHFLARGKGNPWRRVRASVIDGLAEATDDLEPGSEFLTRLNARGRNPEVDYTIFLGTGAMLYDSELAMARKAIGVGRKIPGLRTRTARLDAKLADMDEVLAGKGDGVVALKRGFLPGVKDTVVFPFQHLSVTGPAESDGVREVREELLKRLKGEGKGAMSDE